jgi:pimeloyl-ACP methyl ester carboxylesterase
VAGDGREIVVAFRGTYSVTNTIVDLSTVPQEYVPYPAPPGEGDGDGDADGRCDNCTVHMGFMASWKNAREVVIPALQAAREKYPGYRVHLIGHSLGGAVAALAALELRLGLRWQDVVVTTFGEPRVGNAKLADYIDRAFKLGEGEVGEDLAYRRVTHVGDPVPLLPLTEWGYRSHAGEVYIEKSDLPPSPGDLRLCRGDNDPKCMGGAETADWLQWVLGLMNWHRKQEEVEASGLGRWFPARLKLWQLFFAHRDYFWRLGLCVPGGDPADWGREKYNPTLSEPEDEIRDL